MMIGFVFLPTVLGAVGLLWLAIWPGRIDDVVLGFPLGMIMLPALGFWFVLLICLAFRDIAHDRRQVPARKWDRPIDKRRWGIWSAAIMFATLACLSLHLPQRIVFSFCAGDLQKLASRANESLIKENVDWRVGPYQVDSYETDERGGKFFRTCVGTDGLGPDQMSYGFAMQPNSWGTPFGNARYSLCHLFGEWYAFSVSNDW